MKSELMSIRELFDCCRKHNSDNHIERQFEDKHPLTCYVVVKQ